MPPEESFPNTRAVVVPVDGTDASTRAIPLASIIAGVLDCELVVVSVVSDFRTEAPARVEHMRTHLAAVPDTVDRRIVQARSVTRALAEESEGGLVCLATTAEPFDDEGFRHTVSDGLIAAAASPVVVLGPACPDDPRIARVVVAVDPDHEQDCLRRWATRLAHQLSVPVDIVHVATGEPVTPSHLGPGVRVLAMDDHASVADRLLAEADGALLAMGSHGRTGFRRLIQGSVGAAVIERSAAPVLVVGPNVVCDDT